jgi:multiple sugar transport system ATP-binding protein
VKLVIRPEHLKEGEAGAANTIETTITFVESLGGTTFAYGDHPGAEDTLTCALDGQTHPQAGQLLPLVVPPERVYLFDAQGSAFQRHAQAGRA